MALFRQVSRMCAIALLRAFLTPCHDLCECSPGKKLRLSPIQRKSPRWVCEKLALAGRVPPPDTRLTAYTLQKTFVHLSYIFIYFFQSMNNFQPISNRFASSIWRSSFSRGGFRNEIWKFPETSNSFPPRRWRFTRAESDVRPQRGELGSRSLDIGM